MLYSCTQKTTVGVKGLSLLPLNISGCYEHMCNTCLLQHFGGASNGPGGADKVYDGIDAAFAHVLYSHLDVLLVNCANTQHIKQSPA